MSGLDLTQFRRYVVRPTLRHLELWSPAAEELLLGTALKESGLVYLQQVGGGPARGLYQCEPATHEDIWTHYLASGHRQRLASRVKALLMPGLPAVDQLRGNLAYATAICRVHYLRVPVALPAAGDADGQAAYWKRHYNTHLGAGDPARYAALARRYLT